MDPKDISRTVRDLWRRGDWSKLRRQDLDAFAGADDRAELALMVAGGHFHLPEPRGLDAALAKARDWGASDAQVADTLFSGIRNTLGRLAQVGGDARGAREHLAAALAAPEPTACLDGIEARRQGQLIDMGALEHAAEAVLDDYTDAYRNDRIDPARMNIFETELELLKHELLLTLKLRLSAPESASGAEDVKSRAKAHWAPKAPNAQFEIFAPDMTGRMMAAWRAHFARNVAGSWARYHL